MSPIVRHLVNDHSVPNDNGTYRLRLPDRGALHSLFLKVHITNGSTSGRNVTVLDAIDEIRIQSERQNPIFLLSSQDAEKWTELLSGAPIVTVETEEADAVQEVLFPIWFGRKMYDEGMYLPLERHNAVDLEIDYSPLITADGGFASASITIDVVAIITPPEEKLPYHGTLITRRFNRYTSLASGDTTIELPSNSVIRNVGVSVYEAGVADGSNVSRVQLRKSATGHAILDLDWDDFILFNRQVAGGRLSRAKRLFGQNDDVVNVRIGEVTDYSLSVLEEVEYSDDLSKLANIDAIVGDELTISSFDVDVTAGSELISANTTDITMFLLVNGVFPSYFGFVPFTFPDDVSGYNSVKDHGGIDLVLTNANAGADVEVSIQELIVF